MALVVLAATVSGCGGAGDGNGRVAAGREPSAGTWRTWVLASSDAVPVPAPPTGTKAESEMSEVRNLTSGRDPEIDEAVRRWGQEPANKPWLDLHVELVSAGVKDPPGAARGYALSSVAIYDAVVAAWHWKYVYRREGPGLGGDGTREPSYPSEHAAIAGAASRVLSYVFPERPAERFDELAEEAALSRLQAGANFRSDVDAGLALGRAVADQVIARARSDGFGTRWDGNRPPGIGRGPEFWEPPPGTVTPPTQPTAGSWKTWVLESGDQLRPRPPPAFGTSEHLAQAREVLDVGRGLTEDQKRIAKFWAGGQGTSLPAGIWNQLAMPYIQASGFTTPRAARAIALLNVAQADAGIAVWDAKFTYWSARPINAIRDLGLSPGWTSYLNTPPFPGYPSGHAGFSGAASEVLAYLFPSQAELVQAKAEEATASRLYGGIHFRVDNETSLGMGREIGRRVVARAKADGSGS